MEKYFYPLITIYDKFTEHTICDGERCFLVRVDVGTDKSRVVIKNSLKNELYIPYDIFKDLFKPSIDQKTPL